MSTSTSTTQLNHSCEGDFNNITGTLLSDIKNFRYWKENLSRRGDKSLNTSNMQKVKDSLQNSSLAEIWEIISEDGRSVLHQAAKHGNNNAELIETLVNYRVLRGGNEVVNRKDKGGCRTPLHWACRRVNTAAAVALLEHNLKLMAVLLYYDRDQHQNSKLDPDLAVKVSQFEIFSPEMQSSSINPNDHLTILAFLIQFQPEHLSLDTWRRNHLDCISLLVARSKPDTVNKRFAFTGFQTVTGEQEWLSVFEYCLRVILRAETLRWN